MAKNFLSIMILLALIHSKSITAQINQSVIDKTIVKIQEKHPDAQAERIKKGVNQVAAFWTEKDGNSNDFEKFCTDNFISNKEELENCFKKISNNLESILGCFNKISVDLKLPLHLDIGKITSIDEIYGSYDASAHFNDDMFSNKIAFITILNFPFYNLKEKNQLGKSWDRLQWAYTRLGDIYTSRIPADIAQKVSEAQTASDTYISDYNIMMGKLIDNKGNTLFPSDMKLITHWGLRDELKSNYNAKGFEKQMMIYEVMKHIIYQDIPIEVINNSTHQWNPYSNKIYKDNKQVNHTPETDTRYLYLLNNFKALKALDPYCPSYPTYIQRAFEQNMEIPQEDVEKIFIEFVSSPQVKQVASLISKRLGRKLQPFDIWYDGFKARNTISEDELNSIIQKKYPNKEAFAADLPQILIKLGFTKDKADFITSKITVDASRGAGHAWGAAMKSDNARLRTRIGANGMNYKGYNIAIHEFGHNVEQTITLHDVDHYILNGVPNTGFTEALAFIFQKRDLELLGKKDENPLKEHLLTLDIFWGCYEIMGVSLVDINVWKWLYKNPQATPSELKEKVISTSKEIWNAYYAPIFGIKDQPILAIYSHMIDNPLYLSNYPIGHLIEFQIERYIKDKNFANEVLRMYSYGKVTPKYWMLNAVGSELSSKPMLDATSEALKFVKN